LAVVFDSVQHDRLDVGAHSGKIIRTLKCVGWLRINDKRQFHEAVDGFPQIHEKSEPMVAEHRAMDVDAPAVVSFSNAPLFVRRRPPRLHSRPLVLELVSWHRPNVRLAEQPHQ